MCVCVCMYVTFANTPIGGRGGGGRRKRIERSINISSPYSAVALTLVSSPRLSFPLSPHPPIPSPHNPYTSLQLYLSFFHSLPSLPPLFSPHFHHILPTFPQPFLSLPFPYVFSISFLLIFSSLLPLTSPPLLSPQLPSVSHLAIYSLK